MIVHDVEQGSPEWKAARLGIPTASQFHRIVTPKTLKPSSSAPKYRMELLSEWLTGLPAVDIDGAFIDRGSELETKAREWVELVREEPVQQVGFITNDEGTIGCSPDGLLGDDSGLEIKCPSMHVHLAYLLHGPDANYRLQVQGGMWVAERGLWVFCSYNPKVQARIIEYPRNDAVIDALAEHVGQFCKDLAAEKKILREMGAVPASERKPVTSFAEAARQRGEDFSAVDALFE